MEQQNRLTPALMPVIILLFFLSGLARGAETENPGHHAQDAPTIGGSVSRATFTTAVVNREPIDHVETLRHDQRHVYYFTELKGMTGQTIIHRWQHNGTLITEVSFAVGAPRWRVWSSKTLLPEWDGQWTVSVVNSQGEVIHSDQFIYSAPPPSP